MPADLIAKSKAEVEASREARGRYTALTPGQHLHALWAAHFNGGGWIDEPPSWDDYDEAGHEAWEANAHLIAAAPDLLEIARTARDYASDLASGALISAGGVDCRAVGAEDLVRIDAAIAKATPLSEQMVEDKGRDG